MNQKKKDLFKQLLPLTMTQHINNVLDIMYLLLYFTCVYYLMIMAMKTTNPCLEGRKCIIYRVPFFS